MTRPRKPGPKPLPAAARPVTVSVRIPRPLAARLDAWAAAHGVRQSAAVRALLEAVLTFEEGPHGR